jgi:uncharacterized membrane protein YqjE
MSDETPDAIQFQRSIENLRQERETFDQLKKHDEYWFYLKMVMGVCSVIIMIIVLIFSIFVIINFKSFSETAVIAGIVGLVVDIIGSSASVWKLTMNPKSMSELKPVTTITVSDIKEK